MRYFGKRSVTSVVKVSLNLMWYLFLLILAVGLVETYLGKPFHLIFNPFEFAGLKIEFSSETQMPFFLGLIPFFQFIVLLIIMRFLMRLFNNLAAEKIFIEDNFIYMRKIALIMILYFILDPLATAAKCNYLIPLIQIENAMLSSEPKLMAIIPGVTIGLIILTIAEVFRHAVEIKEENDLTI